MNGVVGGFALLLAFSVAGRARAEGGESGHGTPSPPRAATTATSRLPLLISLGIGASAAGGAVLTGVLAKTEYDSASSSCGPRCTDDQVALSKGLALTSTVLTGVAVLGVGVGVTLLLLEKPSEPGASASSLSVGVSPHAGGAHASAVWSF